MIGDESPVFTVIDVLSDFTVVVVSFFCVGVTVTLSFLSEGVIVTSSFLSAGGVVLSSLSVEAKTI